MTVSPRSSRASRTIPSCLRLLLFDTASNGKYLVSTVSYGDRPCFTLFSRQTSDVEGLLQGEQGLASVTENLENAPLRTSLISQCYRHAQCISFQLIAKKMGDDLLSHEVSLAVPSALAGLTSLFGMGRGVSPPPSSPFLKGIFDCEDRRLIFGNCIALLNH